MKSWTSGLTRKVVLLLALLSAAVPAQNAGWDSVDINGTWVQLGMMQAEVVSRLSEKNTLRKDFDNHWSVWPKGQSELTANLGHVGFIGERLYTASNEVGTAVDTTAARLLNHLYMVISEAEKSGLSVVIRTQKESEVKTQQRVRILSVFIGQKEITVQITQPVGVSGPSFTTLQESIFQHQTPIQPARK